MSGSDVARSGTALTRPAPGPGPRALAALVGLLLLLGLAGGLYLAPMPVAVLLATVGVGLPLLVLVWRRPEVGLLALVFLTLDLIPRNIVDLRLPVGGLDLRDLLLIAMLGMLLLQNLLRRRVTILWWQVSAPLLLFLGLALLSAIYALFIQHVESNWALNELRVVVNYTLFFVAAWSLRRRQQLVVLLVGLFLLADLTGIIILLQQFFGADAPLLQTMTATWRVWRADGGSGGFGSVRIIPPGHVLIYILTIIAFALMVHPRQPRFQRAFFTFHFLFLNGVLLFTYTRAQWLASAVALLLLFLLLPSSDKSLLLRNVLFLLVVGMVLFSLTGPELAQRIETLPFLEAVTTRAESLFNPEETLDTYSLSWRTYEAEEANRSIRQHPLFGLGLGAIYREPTLLQYISMDGTSQRFTRYMHNSFHYVAVKMGLVGLALFLWFYLAAILGGWHVARQGLPGQEKRIALAIMASLVGLVPWAIYHSHFMEVEGAATVGMVVGILASLPHLARRTTAAPPATGPAP